MFQDYMNATLVLLDLLLTLVDLRLVHYALRVLIKQQKDSHLANCVQKASSKINRE